MALTTRAACVALALALIGAPAARASGDDDERMVVVEAARVITVSGEVFQPGTIIVEGGRIRLVGSRLEYPPSARVIEARRETVMPGMIDVRTRFRLPRYGRSRNHAGARARLEVYPSEIEFEEFLRAGYTHACFVPAGTGIPGYASLYRAGGANGPAPVADSAYLRVTMTNPSRDKSTLRRALGKAKKAIEKREKARAKWEKKQEEAAAKAAEKSAGKGEKQGAGSKPRKPAPKNAAGDDGSPPEKGKESSEKEKKPATFEPPPVDPDLVPFVALFDAKEGEVPVRILFEVQRASHLVHLADALDGYPEVTGDIYLDRSFYNDYREVIDDIAERECRVLLSPAIERLPYTANRFNLAADLAARECPLVFVPRTDSTRELRGMRARVADLVRAGLDREAALTALTLHAAEFLGLEKERGSIEKGKVADLLFLDGDPLRPETRVTRVMIDGELAWEREDDR